MYTTKTTLSLELKKFWLSQKEIDRLYNDVFKREPGRILFYARRAGIRRLNAILYSLKEKQTWVTTKR